MIKSEPSPAELKAHRTSQRLQCLEQPLQILGVATGQRPLVEDTQVQGRVNSSKLSQSQTTSLTLGETISARSLISTHHSSKSTPKAVTGGD